MSFYTAGLYRGISSLTGSILEASSPGNYTLHFLNRGTGNVTGQLVVAASTVVFSQPYLYLGVTTIVLAAVFTIGTIIISWRKPRPITAGSGTSSKPAPAS